MESIGGVEVRSVIRGANPEDVGVGLEFLPDAQRLTPATQPGNGSSFTALLELPATQAMELLHSSQPDEAPSSKLSPGEDWIEQNPEPYNSIPVFPWNTPLVDHPSKFHGVVLTDYLPESSSRPSSNFQKVKQEPVDSDSSHNSSPAASDPMLPSPNQQKSAKRKEGEKKVKGSNKKSKSSANETSEDGEKLPYVHFRARRGQATNSHSLAERARREKINARMKLLQELVPGCNKISGTAMVLDEIINHVQSLQRQVEILSMRLAAVNPKIDFSLNSLLAEESGFLMDGSFLGMTVPSAWPEGQINLQQHEQLWHFDELHHPVWNGEEDKPSFITPENSILSYQTFANSASMHTNQVKMEI